MDVGILSYKTLKGGHFYIETSNGCYYVKDTRKDIGDSCSCRLCCEVFQGVKKSSEASKTNKVRDRDTLLFISQNTEKYLRGNKHSLEAVNIALSLGVIDGFTKENRTQYMFFASQDRTGNEQKLKLLINYIQNDHSRNKDFSPIIIGTGGDNPHVSTLLIDHSNCRLFLFDTSEDIHQKRDSATGTVLASTEIFGNLASNIRCLNTTGQALQDDSSCTYWATCFADTLQNCNSISDIIKGQRDQEFLNPDVLDKTIDRLCQVDSSMVIGLNDPHMKNFAPDSPAGNLLQFLQNKMIIRQNLSVFAFQGQREGVPAIDRGNDNAHARHRFTPDYRGFF